MTRRHRSDVLLAQFRQQRRIADIGDLAAEDILGAVPFAAGVGDGMIELAIDLRSLEGHAGDIAGIELSEEIAVRIALPDSAD